MSQTKITQKLDRKFASGLAWTTGSKWMIQLVSWAGLVVVTRLLSPKDFGLVEMAAIVIFFSQSLFDFGIGNAIIQMKELPDSTLRQLNILVMALALVVYLLVLILAPYISDFFNAEQLHLLIVVNSLVFFLQAGQVVPANILRRDLDYRTLAASEALLSVSQLSVTLVSAFNGFAFWSLVLGQLAGQFASLAFLIHRQPIGFSSPKWTDVREAVHFGWHVGIGQLSYSVYSQSDGLAVGRNLGEVYLGNYRLALSIAIAPIDKVASLVSRVTAPMFSHVQEDHALMRRYLLRFTELLTVVTIPASLGMACVAPELVVTLFGEKWSAVAGPLRWLCVNFVFRCFSILMAQAMFALRESRFMMNLSLLNTAVMPLLFWFASSHGLEAVAIAWLAIVPFSIVPTAVLLFKRIGLPVKDYLNACLPALSGSTAMAIAVLFTQRVLTFTQMPLPWKLALEVAVGVLVYSLIGVLFFRKRLGQYVLFLRTLRKEKAAPAP